jgi:hypothetical protein
MMDNMVLCTGPSVLCCEVCGLFEVLVDLMIAWVFECRFVSVVVCVRACTSVGFLCCVFSRYVIG